MRKGLGEVTKLPPRVRIVLLGQKSEIVPQREQSFEERARVFRAAD